MTSPNLDNLVAIGQLKAEPSRRREFEGLLRSGRARLHDARIETLSLESRFDLAYNAAHSLALAALRWHGYRSENRYLVFQVLPHTIAAGPEVWRVLAHCHGVRNRSEYEGHLDLGAQMVTDLILAAETVLKKVTALPPLP